MFNLAHLETGFKVDLIVKKSRPFSLTELSRRQTLPYLGKARWFATAEDTVLAKLEWARKGNSERQVADALNVARVRGQDLDRAYLRRWAEDLGSLNCWSGYSRKWTELCGDCLGRGKDGSPGIEAAARGYRPWTPKQERREEPKKKRKG